MAVGSTRRIVERRGVWSEKCDQTGKHVRIVKQIRPTAGENRVIEEENVRATASPAFKYLDVQEREMSP